MLRSRRWGGRRRLLGGVALAAGLVGAVVLRARHDPWPARVVITPPPGHYQGRGFSADGRLFFLTGPTGRSAWDTATGAARPVPDQALLWNRAEAPDRRSFVGWEAIGGGQSDLIWADSTTGAVRKRVPVGPMQVLHPRIAPDNRTARAALMDRQGRTEAATWDLASGDLVRHAVPGPGPAGFVWPRTSGFAGPMAVAPDDRTWVYYDLVRDGIQLWDANADRPIGQLLQAPTTHRAFLGMPTFTPDGRELLAGRDDGQVEVWDVAEGRLVRLIKVHPAHFYPYLLEWSPDGRTFASTGLDHGSGTTFGWARHQFYRYLAPGWGRSATREVVLLDFPTGATLARSRGSIYPHFATDGRTVALATEDGTFTIRDTPPPPPPGR